jgi:hypothetical protein
MKASDLAQVKFFFSLSTWGPTRRRKSTGLAQLWGGWPIEQVCVVPKKAGFSIPRLKTLGPPWGQMSPTNHGGTRWSSLGVDTNAKVTDFLPFCAIGISMYQKMLYQNLTPSLHTISYVHKS